MEFEKILKQLAQRHGVTPEEIYRDIQAAIAAADKLPAEAGTTPEEVLAYVGRRAAERMKNEEGSAAK